MRHRCAFANPGPPRPGQHVAWHKPRNCGRTAYPSLTGQQSCGTFTFAGLNSHPHCNDAERTLPICVTKPAHTGTDGQTDLNFTEVWRDLPTRLRSKARLGPTAFSQSGVSRTTSPYGCSQRATRRRTIRRSRSSEASGRTAPRGSSSPAATALARHTTSIKPRTTSYSSVRSRRHLCAISARSLAHLSAASRAHHSGTKDWLVGPPRYAGLSGMASTEWARTTARSDFPRGMPIRCTQASAMAAEIEPRSTPG